jgi:hypothetical protein
VDHTCRLSRSLSIQMLIIECAPYLQDWRCSSAITWDVKRPLPTHAAVGGGYQDSLKPTQQLHCNAQDRSIHVVSPGALRLLRMLLPVPDHPGPRYSLPTNNIDDDRGTDMHHRYHEQSLIPRFNLCIKGQCVVFPSRKLTHME